MKYSFLFFALLTTLVVCQDTSVHINPEAPQINLPYDFQFKMFFDEPYEIEVDFYLVNPLFAFHYINNII
jgi:hypothetical protein